MRTQLSFDMFGEDEEKKSSIHSTSRSASQFPAQFINDVNSFLAYCSDTSISLTKTTQTLSRKHLQQVNDILSVKAESVNTYSSQEFYPYINFIFQILLAGRLVDIHSNRKNLILGDSDRLTSFKEFTASEKYCFLLETFWVDMDWDDLLFSNTNQVTTAHAPVFTALYTSEENKKWNIVNPKTATGELLSLETQSWHHFFQYFEWFGLWICESDTERMKTYYRKNSYFAKNITVTTLGKQMMPILLIDRSLHLWNISLRKLFGSSDWIPGKPDDYIRNYGLTAKDAKKLELVFSEDQSMQPFYLPFVPLFAEGTLTKTLPRIQNSFQNGAYTLRVNYTKTIWRKIKLPATATMEDVHYEILDAYQFDDDHLYSFFTDGKKWSKHCIASPNDTFTLSHASNIQLGSIGMKKNEPLLYLYDYGDEWTFTVVLEEIDEQHTQYFEPYLIEAEGESPQQYFYEEDEW